MRAKVDKDDTQSLVALENLYKIIEQYKPEFFYNINKTRLFLIATNI